MWLLLDDIKIPDNMPATSGTAVIYVMVACVVAGISLVTYLVQSSRADNSKMIDIFKGLTEESHKTFKESLDKVTASHDRVVDKIMNTHEKAIDKLTEKIEGKNGGKQS